MENINTVSELVKKELDELFIWEEQKAKLIKKNKAYIKRRKRTRAILSRKRK